MIGKTNAISKPGVELSLTVSATTGAAVVATNGTKTVTGVSVAGACVLKLPEAGTYTVSATLSGQSSDVKTVTVVNNYSVALSFFSATITVTIDSGATVVLKKGSTTVATKTSTGTAVFTVTETGTYIVTATKGSQSDSGTVTVTSSQTSYAITLTFVSSTLNDNAWDVIKSVSDAGQGANYWSVGDRKAVVLNGTMGSLSLSSYTTYAFIIGFNHNAAVEGTNRIHFQVGKTALTGGTDVCLCDSKYKTQATSGSYFNMNNSQSNTGGWASSRMRTVILGTSLTSYSGTFIGVLPAELRAVLKSVTKYTDNTDGTSGSSSAVTATTDYAFLLSEYEVYGSQAYANSYEENKQAQYAYYSAGNSKVRYKHTATDTAARWRLRSPACAGNITGGFCSVNTDGTANWYAADSSYGVSPGLCV